MKVISQKANIFAKCPRRAFTEFSVRVTVLKPQATIQEITRELAPRIAEHYAIDNILRKWDRARLADFVSQKVPVSKIGKSGDLGEILATEYINSGTLPYRVPINRLRWKDSRDLPMRGEDLVGFHVDQKPLGFLKGEAKSRKILTQNVVAQAREALGKNSGLPLAHTLAFIAERLFEANQDDLANQIEEYVARRLPSKSQVAHLIFTFSGNDPSDVLKEDATKLGAVTKDGVKTQYSVGMHTDQHQELIEAVFAAACNGRNL